MQQALPDIQRESEALDGKLATIFQLRTNVVSFKRGAKILPAGGKLTGFHRHAGSGFNFLEDFWTPGIKVRQSNTQAADQQRGDHNERGSSKQ